MGNIARILPGTFLCVCSVLVAVTWAGLIIELPRTTPLIDPISVCKLEAGRPTYARSMLHNLDLRVSSV